MAEKRDRAAYEPTDEEVRPSYDPPKTGSALLVCAQPPVERIDVSHIEDPDRANAIIAHRTKWVSGTTLRYYFFDALDPMWDIPTDATWFGDTDQRAVLREAFAEWEAHGIGVAFEETDLPSEAEIRIGFVDGDGSWSYIGRQILNHLNPRTRTMNLGWDVTTAYGRDTARHEIGHTLGMPHEHQNPYAGIVWDELATLTYFAGPPNNWDPSKTQRNVLRKLNGRDVFGSSWDRDSIMHYGFPAGLIIAPAALQDGHTPQPGFSPRDVAWVQAWYPPTTLDDLVVLQVNQSHPIQITPGAQAHFLIEPTATRNYVMTTLGQSDTVMVLFEEIGGVWRQVTGDDDSGEATNARIRWKLFLDRRYALRVRLYHSNASDEIAVVMF